MDKETYYRIRDEVYKNAGNDKFDFDLMLTRVVTKAVEDEREACAKVCEAHAQVYANLPKSSATDAAWAACIDLQDAIRARGQ